MRISIVMPSLNQANFIAKSLESIFSQSIDDLEVLVIDSMSTDGTIDILRSFQAKYPSKIKWISSKDSGPAEAINYGFKAASGEIVGWLNSDDLYSKVTLKKVLDFFKKNRAKNIVYGHGDLIDEHGNFIGQYPTKPPKTGIEEFNEGSFICQPTLFFRKSILDEVGYLDTSLKLSFDFDWWIRFFKSMPNEIGFISETLAHSRLHASCLTKKQRKTVAVEGMKVLKRYFDEVPSTWALTYIDEICSQYPFTDDSRSLVQIIESFLTEIKSLLSADDLQALIKELQVDKRLTLSSDMLYVDVSPDGWASEHTVIKLRYTKNAQAKHIEIGLAGDWPTSQDMVLRISTPLGTKFTSTLNTMQSGKWKLEIPQFSTDAFTEWMITTDDFFIPSAADKASDDNRKLSFRVTSLKLIE
jgi:glycosyltransferase involved in cell wall biosynthesis